MSVTPSDLKNDTTSGSAGAADVKGDPNEGISTLSVHAGEARQKPSHGLVDSIVLASTFSFEDTQALVDFVKDGEGRSEYSRYGTPGDRVVEAKLAALEGAEEGVLYSSGMAAFAGVLNSVLSQGDEIIFFDECYHRSREYCRKHLARFGVKTIEVKTGDYDAMEAAITPNTKLLVSESPTNPHMSIVDLDRFAAIGKENNVLTIIDATLATPFNIQPIAHGVDLVMHSATKYLGGHNDLLAGVVLGSKKVLDPIRNLRGIMGAVNSPHSCYLLQRGLKTFGLRMKQHNENGMRVAEYLQSHPRVEKLFYPGLESHAYHGVAKETMRGYGGMVTFNVKDADWEQTARVVDAAKLARIAPSLGGVETLIEQPLVMSYMEFTPEERVGFGIDDNMIRLACGIEDAKDIIADLEQCLEAK